MQLGMGSATAVKYHLSKHIIRVQIAMFLRVQVTIPDDASQAMSHTRSLLALASFGDIHSTPD